MSQHAGPPRGGEAPAVPEPTFAERARTLAYLGRTGTLATLPRLPGGAGPAARPAYLAGPARARHWVDFEDFAFWRLEVHDTYFVGGFAAMGWVGAAEYLAARPAPLADVAAGLREHMNQDHADALVAYARHFAGAPAEEATMGGAG